MADPFAISLGIITVVGAAYTSCKVLGDAIRGYKNAPKTLKALGQELGAVDGQLEVLKRELSELYKSSLSPNQKACFDNLSLISQQCQVSCGAFKAKLAELTGNSSADHIHPLDKARLHLAESDIALFKAELERYKQTLDIAIGIATIRSVRDNREALQSLETKIVSSISSFAGQAQGLQLAMQSLSLGSISKDDLEAVVVNALDQQSVMLARCLKLCDSVLRETTIVTGTSVKHAETFDTANQWVGNIGFDGSGGDASGAPAVVVDRLIARNQAFQGAGNMSKEAAKDFFRR